MRRSAHLRDAALRHLVEDFLCLVGEADDCQRRAAVIARCAFSLRCQNEAAQRNWQSTAEARLAPSTLQIR